MRGSVVTRGNTWSHLVDVGRDPVFRVAGASAGRCLLLAAGVHPKIVSEHLGESNVSIALDLYSHVIPGLQAEAAEKLGETIRDVNIEALESGPTVARWIDPALEAWAHREHADEASDSNASAT